jgi:hypothetical protein
MTSALTSYPGSALKSAARSYYPNEVTGGNFSFPKKKINDVRKLFVDLGLGECSLVSAAIFGYNHIYINPLVLA